MDTSRLLRSTVALVAVALLAGAIGMTLIAGLDAAGLSGQSAYIIGAGTAVAVTLAISDTYTPIGSGPTHLLRDQPREKLVVDFLVVCAVAASVAAVVAFAGFGNVAGGILGIGVSVAVGYGAFIARNLSAYRPQDHGQPRQVG